MIKVHWLMYLTDLVWPGLFYNHLHDWFIHSLSHWVIFHLNLQDIINPKPLELGTWTFGSMFTLHHVSHITCQVSGVRCQFSPSVSPHQRSFLLLSVLLSALVEIFGFSCMRDFLLLHRVLCSLKVFFSSVF